MPDSVLIPACKEINKKKKRRRRKATVFKEFSSQWKTQTCDSKQRKKAQTSREESHAEVRLCDMITRPGKVTSSGNVIMEGLLGMWQSLRLDCWEVT